MGIHDHPSMVQGGPDARRTRFGVLNLATEISGISKHAFYSRRLYHGHAELSGALDEQQVQVVTPQGTAISVQARGTGG
jgi:hypothetical protein